MCSAYNTILIAWLNRHADLFDVHKILVLFWWQFRSGNVIQNLNAAADVELLEAVRIWAWHLYSMHYRYNALRTTLSSTRIRSKTMTRPNMLLSLDAIWHKFICIPSQAAAHTIQPTNHCPAHSKTYLCTISFSCLLNYISDSSFAPEFEQPIAVIGAV